MEETVAEPKSELRLPSFLRPGVDAVIVTRQDGSKFVRIEAQGHYGCPCLTKEHLELLSKELT